MIQLTDSSGNELKLRKEGTGEVRLKLTISQQIVDVTTQFDFQVFEAVMEQALQHLDLGETSLFLMDLTDLDLWVTETRVAEWKNYPDLHVGIDCSDAGILTLSVFLGGPEDEEGFVNTARLKLFSVDYEFRLDQLRLLCLEILKAC